MAEGKSAAVAPASIAWALSLLLTNGGKEAHNGPRKLRDPGHSLSIKKLANNLASSGWGLGMGGLGGQILTGVVKNSVGRVFRG